MKTLFIKNPTSVNVGVQFVDVKNATIENLGLEGAFAVAKEDARASVCLAPPRDVEMGENYISDASVFNGKFVVQIDQVVIPLIFKSKDLGKYFNENNVSGTGVVFSEVYTSEEGHAYRILNLDPASDHYVRIYAVSSDASFTPSEDFTLLDDFTAGIGIGLSQIVIDCTGALDFSGILVLPEDAEGFISSSYVKRSYKGIPDLVESLENSGFSVHELTRWKKAVTTGIPRAGFVTDSPLSLGGYDRDDLLSVKLTRDNVTTTHAGLVSEVFDACQSKGILLAVNNYNFCIGTEPDTPVTEVEIELLAGSEISIDGLTNLYNFQNDTSEIINNRKFKCIVGWDDATSFWCMSPEVMFVGANGVPGDTIIVPVDYRMTDEPLLTPIPSESDYTEVCQNTAYPEDCQRNQQLAFVTDLINAAFEETGRCFTLFNQQWVWGPLPNPETFLVSSGDYLPSCVRIVEAEISSQVYYGYAIPEPERPM